jgi:hypothetical protein
VAEYSDLKIQVTLTIAELRDLVALINLATDAVLAAEQKVPDIVEDLSRMYFELVEDLRQDGIFGNFQPE